jgi:hypothetical protein
MSFSDSRVVRLTDHFRACRSFSHLIRNSQVGTGLSWHCLLFTNLTDCPADCFSNQVETNKPTSVWRQDLSNLHKVFQYWLSILWSIGYLCNQQLQRVSVGNDTRMCEKLYVWLLVQAYTCWIWMSSFEAFCSIWLIFLLLSGFVVMLNNGGAILWKCWLAIWDICVTRESVVWMC